MKNNFDCLHFNLDELKKKLFIDKKISRKEFLPNFFKKYFDGFLIHFNIYKKLISSGLIDEWFEEFNYFWINYLQGRPLYFNDFSFLLGVYRQKFQNIVNEVYPVTINSLEYNLQTILFDVLSVDGKYCEIQSGNYYFGRFPTKYLLFGEVHLKK